jgi:hypothetical protein
MAHLCWCASVAVLLILAGCAAYSVRPEGDIVGLYDNPAYGLDAYDGVGLYGRDGHWHDHDSWHGSAGDRRAGVGGFHGGFAHADSGGHGGIGRG